MVLSCVMLWWKQWNWTTTNHKNPTMNHEWTSPVTIGFSVQTKQEKPTRGLAGPHWGVRGKRKKTDVGEPWTLPFLWLRVSRLPRRMSEYVCAVWDSERPRVQHLSGGSASTSITLKLVTTLSVSMRCTGRQMEEGCRFKQERKEVGQYGIYQI